MQIGQLVGMKLDRNIMRLGRIEDAGDFVGQEGDAFAKTVNRIGQIFSGDSRKHIVDDAVDIGGLVAIHFRWQGMRAEEGGADRHVTFFAKTAGGFQ